MFTFIFVFVAISVLILVHEWGHFFAARWLGVRVEEFGFGFPPRIFSRVKNGVRYSVNALPLGGFVKIFGEHGEGEGAKNSFISRPAWQRLVILVAGVGMNLVFAWLLFSVASGIGLPQVSDREESGVPIVILGVSPKSPAEQAGLKFGDTLLEMRRPEISLRIETEKDVQNFVDAYRGEEMVLVVRRGARIREIRAIPRINAPADEGALGIAMGQLIVSRVPWYVAPVKGLETTVRTGEAIGTGLWETAKQLVARRSSGVDISGPVGIFFFITDARVLGLGYLLQFIGVLAMNLAVLNLLPIPALDGGRVLFLVIEKIKGRRASPRVENAAHMVGFMALVILMALVTWRDIARLL